VSRPGETEIVVEALAGRGVVVRVLGDLDLASADELEVALARGEHGQSLIVDLTDCTFLDSSALRTLFERAAAVEAAGGRVAVVAQAPLRRTLEIAGLDKRLAIRGSLDAALD
jgi:anti-anti-sigma factor